MAGIGPTGPRGVIGLFDGPIGGYVHIPFCQWICPFCPYNKVLARDDLANRYFRSLAREIGWYVQAARMDEPGWSFTSLYIGGGTPTLYPDALAEILELAPATGERAVEVLPNHATVPRLEQLRAIGFNAVSIGAQSFHDGVLQRLHRPHDGRTALAAVQAAAGRFDLVDVDLIVDVALDAPAAYPGAFIADVRTCFELGVDQVSTYPLMRFGYTPFGTARHDRRREHEVLREVSELAGRMGYERRSVWTFNRLQSPAYTSITRPRFLGMGAGSSAYAGRDFLVNHFGLGPYCDAVEAGQLPIARWLHLGRVGGAGYDAFWQAYAGRVSPAGLTRSFGAGALAVRAILPPLRLVGLLSRQGGEYRLTPRGFDTYHDLERWVTYQFIEPLWAQMMQEHAAEATARWARPAAGRHGRVWSGASRLMERPAGELGLSCPNAGASSQANLG